MVGREGLTVPDYPRYQSKARLTTQQPAFQAASDTTGQILEKQAQIGQDLQKIALQWEASQRSTRNTFAEVNFESDVLSIQQRAIFDADPNNKQLYLDELNKSFEKNSKDLDEENKLKLGLKAQFASSKLDNLFKKKWLEADELAVGKFIDQQIANPTDNGISLVNEMIDEKVAVGNMSDTTAYNLRHAAERDIKFSLFRRDLGIDPAEAENKFKSNDYGFNVDEMPKARNILQESNRLILDKTVTNRLSVLKDFSDGKISLDNSALINQITISDPELGEAIKKGTSDVFIASPSDEAFADATRQIFSASSREEIATYLMNVLSQNANREISRERLAILINAATEHSSGISLKDTDHPVAQTPKQIEVKAAVKNLLNQNPLFSTGNMIVNFFKGVSQGQTPVMAHDEALKAEVNRTNPLSMKYKIGDVITNQQGVSGEVIGFDDNGVPILKRIK